MGAVIWARGVIPIALFALPTCLSHDLPYGHGGGGSPSNSSLSGNKSRLDIFAAAAPIVVLPHDQPNALWSNPSFVPIKRSLWFLPACRPTMPLCRSPRSAGWRFQIVREIQLQVAPGECAARFPAHDGASALGDADRDAELPPRRPAKAEARLHFFPSLALLTRLSSIFRPMLSPIFFKAGN